MTPQMVKILGAMYDLDYLMRKKDNILIFHQGMIESLMNGKTNGFTYAMINTLLAGLRTKLFETKTVGELISGIK